MSIAFFFFSYYMFDCTTRTRWFSMHVMHFVAGHCVLTHRHFLISPLTPVDCQASMGLAPPSCVSAHYLSCACCPTAGSHLFSGLSGPFGGGGWSRRWLPSWELHCQRCLCLYGRPGQISVCPGCPRRSQTLWSFASHRLMGGGGALVPPIPWRLALPFAPRSACSEHARAVHDGTCSSVASRCAQARMPLTWRPHT